MSEEKVLTLRGKKAVWAPGGGPIDPKRLPEGYPYKERGELVIEWDGNTEGLEAVSGMYYLISPEILTDEQIKAGVIETSHHVIASVSDRWDAMLEHGVVTEEIVAIETIIFVRKTNAEYNGVSFPEPGVYSILYSGIYNAKFSTFGETIHPMAPEFLPLLTSPNGTKYQLTVSDDGTLSAVAVE